MASDKELYYDLSILMLKIYTTEQILGSFIIQKEPEILKYSMLYLFFKLVIWKVKTWTITVWLVHKFKCAQRAIEKAMLGVSLKD